MHGSGRWLVLGVLLALGALAGAAPQFGEAGLRLLDAQFRMLRALHPRAAPREVVVVGIDERTLAALPEPIALWHRHLGDFLHAMALARPAAVGLDLVLPDRSYDAVQAGLDRALISGLLAAKRVTPVILARTVDARGRPRPLHAPLWTVAGEANVGFVLFPVDPDGRVRRYTERLGEAGERLPTLAGEMARRLGADPGEGWIDYARGAPLRSIALQTVLGWYAAGDRASLRRAFAGKPVILGTLLPFTDRHAVPVALAAGDAADDTPGVMLHAQLLANLLGHGLLRDAPRALSAGLPAAAALLWLLPAGWLLALIVFLASGALLLAASSLLLVQGSVLPIVPALAVGGGALLARNAWETFALLRERRRLRTSFSRYVSPAVLREILAGRLRPEPGGEQRFVCILFADLRGHTTRSEHMAPIDVIRFLNRYFESVVGIIHGHGGTVASFMGDGIMAVFGAPQALDNPCEAAFASGREMLQFVSGLNARLQAQGAGGIEIGVGINAGIAVCGHIGSAARNEYTATGDVTNLASRLESLTKTLGYRLVLTRETAGHLTSKDGLEPIGLTPIPGRSAAELMGYDKR